MHTKERHAEPVCGESSATFFERVHAKGTQNVFAICIYSVCHSFIKYWSALVYLQQKKCFKSVSDSLKLNQKCNIMKK